MSRAVLAWILEQLDAGERVALASVIEASGSVPGKPGAKMAVTSSGAVFGTVGGAGLEYKVHKRLIELLEIDRSITRKQGGEVEIFQLFKDAKGKEVTALDSLCGGRLTVAFEVMEPVPHILIAGGGHVGRCVAIVADTLGWSHTVFDVREEYANAEKYPYAKDTISYSVKDLLSSEDSESVKRFSDILLLGHDWNVDQDLLIGFLQIREGDTPRIGAIGSRSKMKAFTQAALDSGLTQDVIDSVRCPIGIEIGADSPEEIAVAVCAEILALERNAL